ncbi:MAG: hypothetical protein HY246_26655, partial [Proteobacteria bacterium]|nr:hypothetical protein [Pseudomonadota bacterium]
MAINWRLRRTFPVFVLSAGLFALPAVAGDVGHAQRTLDFIEREFAGGTPGGLRHAQEGIEQIKEDLVGLDEATKAPLAKRLDEIEKKVEAATFADDRARYMRTFTRKMDAAKDLIAPGQENVRLAFRSTPEDLERAEKELQSDDAKKFLNAAERQTAVDQLAAIRQGLGERAVRQQASSIEERIKAVEQAFPELVEAAKDVNNGSQFERKARNISEDLKAAAAGLKELPSGNARVSELAARLIKVADAYNVVVVNALAGAVLDELQHSWKEQTEDAAEWNEEIIGPTLVQYVAAPNSLIKTLNSPKTVALVTAADSWLAVNFALGYAAPAGSQPVGEYKGYLGHPQIKALVDEVAKQRELGASRLAKFA